jgi:trigger factor
VKSDVETLGPTRVRLTVEVPFDELRPALDEAYRKAAEQVRIKGFRPGKVPPQLIDQRVGRGTIVQEAVTDSIPHFYAEAVRTHELRVMGQPEVDLREFADGAPLVFAAEVDVRPQITLPDYDGLAVTVDDATATDEEIDEQLTALRERFAVLTSAERPIRNGDYAAIDLSVTIDGEAVEDGTMTGVSHEVGSGRIAVPGLDDALVGMSAGETKSFGAVLTTGSAAGRPAEVQVTVRSVKEKQLPDLDDEFAQTASEFDTLAELRADARQRLERVGRLRQRLQARDRTLTTLVGLVDVELPERAVADEAEHRRRMFREQLADVGMTEEQYAEAEGRPVEEIQAELDDGAREAMKTQLVLDALAEKEQLTADQREITDHIVRRAERYGVSPEQYARSLLDSGGIGVVVADLLRNKALALVLESAKVTDASGRPVDLSAPLYGHAESEQPATTEQPAATQS